MKKIILVTLLININYLFAQTIDTSAVDNKENSFGTYYNQLFVDIFEKDSDHLFNFKQKRHIYHDLEHDITRDIEKYPFSNLVYNNFFQKDFIITRPIQKIGNTIAILHDEVIPTVKQGYYLNQFTHINNEHIQIMRPWNISDSKFSLIYYSDKYQRESLIVEFTISF